MNNYDQMRFTILEEINSTLPKSLFSNNYYSTNQIKSNHVGFDERGKTRVPGEKLPPCRVEKQQTRST